MVGAWFLAVALCVPGTASDRGSGSNETARPVEIPRRYRVTGETNPVFNRARGYLDKGKLQIAVSNYGNFVDWDHNPAGLWGNFMYIPNLSLMVGIPGELKFLEQRDWIDLGGNVYLTRNFGDIKFLFLDDTLGTEKSDLGALSQPNEWYYDPNANELYLYSPRPPAERKLVARMAWAYAYDEQGQIIDTNNNGVADPDDFYGSPDSKGTSVIESWMDRTGGLRTDWEAADRSKLKTFSGDLTAGEVYGGIYTREDDTYPLLATSGLPETWPIVGYDEETGTAIRKWPGWWADKEIDGVWVQDSGRFVSDQDVYLVFDDRWADYPGHDDVASVKGKQGHPLGLRVFATAHSYGRAYAEDIIFITMKIVNVSNDPTYVLPDGSAPNGGEGWDYSGAYVGFYFDVDSYSALANGSFAGRTNDDDMMGYITEHDIAYIYDKDDKSGGYTGLAYTGIKLLDSPNSSSYLDLNGDGVVNTADLNGDGRIDDRFPGDFLGMTDWHWFDWYTRPGVATAETNSGPFTGDDQTPPATNKEMIQYQVMSGDTAIPALQQEWYFHPDPQGRTNPHFDSIESLEQDNPEGLDCVFIMSSGPFDFPRGDTVNFSFCVLMGQNREDLIRNAEMAQIMYDLHYQGFSPPTAPTVSAVPGNQRVELFWDDAAEYSLDIVTGYADFEGYKVYKSTDGGITWGDPERDIIYDNTGVAVGWKPIAIFDYTAEEDISRYGREISGPDPLAPWFSLGENAGLQHSFVDEDVENGVEYTYAVTAYDIGIEPPYTIEWVIDSVLTADSTWQVFYLPETTWSENNPDRWFGLASLENAKGNNVTDPQFVKVIPTAMATNITGQIQFIPGADNFGNGVFRFQVVDLEALTGDDYQVVIHAEPSDPLYDNSPPYANPTFSVFRVTGGDTAVVITRSGDTLYHSDQIGYFGYPEKNTDFFDGIRLGLTNYRPAELASQGYIKEMKWGPGGAILFVGYYGEDTLEISLQPKQVIPVFHDYRFEFGPLGLDTTDIVPLPFPGYGTMLLPFRITNLMTGQVPQISANDFGEDGSVNMGNPDEYEADGKWNRGEALTLIEKQVDYVNPDEAIPTWLVTIAWSGTSPAEFPWTETHVCTVVTKKPFFDGDTWTFSTRDLVTPAAVTEEMLRQVKVVPNPYLVSARWEQVAYQKKLQFQNLPDKCTVKIFTLGGDLVRILKKDDPFRGDLDWDLTTYNRQEVAPGLYIFTVEAGGQKYIGKFAIVR
jgi:hypothetical protein